MADELSGYVDITSVHTESETRSRGTAVESETDGFLQQYGLTLNKNIYPKLRLLVNGVFEKDRFDTSTDGSDITSTLTGYRPSIDLTLRDPFYKLGGNYSKQQFRRETSGTSPRTMISETYAAIAGWRPSGLPSIETRWLRSNVYDKERLSQDLVDDLFSLTSWYDPVERLDLQYQFSTEDIVDKLADTEIRNQTHNGKASYDGRLLNDRVSFSTDYQIIRRETEVVKSPTGEVIQQVFATSALFSLNDTPALGKLDANTALVNNDTTMSAGITVGLPLTAPGSRNIGLDFGLETQVDTVAVWTIWNNASLPAEIAGVFTWEVYTSADGENWTSHGFSPAAFDPFRNRFEIRFAPLKTRYIKAVVKPLTPAQALLSPIFSTAADQQIFVTEIQAFFRTTATGPITTMTQMADVIVRARLLDVPVLLYDFSFTTLVSEGLSTRRISTLANCLSASQRFSDIYSGSARIGREDIDDQRGGRTAYLYNATFYALPIKTVSNVLTYSGRREKAGEQESNRDSIYLSNTAALYRGVDAFLSGGISYETNDTERRSTNTSLLFGASITPRPNLTVTPNVFLTRVRSSGGGQPDMVMKTRREDLSVTYAPFPKLYIAASWSVSEQGDRRDRLQNYNIGWSPFSGGALQLTASYTETIQSFDDNISKLLSETARWNINSRTALQASVFQLHSTSSLQDSRSSGASFDLRFTF